MGRAAIDRKAPAQAGALRKCATGIRGLDEITGGGLPAGRPTLLCGSAGSGKTLLGMEFLARGARRFGENGVFVAFEETAEELAANTASLGLDVEALIAAGKLVIDHVHVERHEVVETGEYDLEGLFIRLGQAIDRVGAKRVVLDAIETLFSGLSNVAVLRAELRRLFRWLKEKGVTSIITGEQGGNALTRHGIEEYVSDCVILLDHRVTDQVSTRRLRVVKYRGSVHGTNEYPFVIDESGVAVLPITSAGLEHPAPTQRISSGVERLDTMLGGKGFFRGSSVLVSGTAGTGKSTLAAHFTNAACRRGERILYYAFEESPNQIIRNMRSIGVDLQPWLDKGLLKFQAVRSSMAGLETHLAGMHKLVTGFKPAAVVMDPITNLITVGTPPEVKAMLLRVVDLLKSGGITSFFTSLTAGGDDPEATDTGISSLIDTWLLLRDLETDGERNRGLYVLKSRGMAHSNQIREFVMSAHGIEIRDVYVGPEGVLTGSARLAQEAREREAAAARRREIERRARLAERRRRTLEARIAALTAAIQTEEDEMSLLLAEEQRFEGSRERDRADMARNRRADVTAGADPGRKSNGEGVRK